jgi:hypothetical protein
MEHINGLLVSRFRGTTGFVTQVERDTKNRNDWDICEVVIESRYTHRVPAFGLDLIAQGWNEAKAA